MTPSTGEHGVIRWPDVLASSVHCGHGALDRCRACLQKALYLQIQGPTGVLRMVMTPPRVRTRGSPNEPLRSLVYATIVRGPRDANPSSIPGLPGIVVVPRAE